MADNDLTRFLRVLGQRTVDGQSNHMKCIMMRGEKKPRGGPLFSAWFSDVKERELELSFIDEREKDQFLDAVRAHTTMAATPVAQTRVESNYHGERRTCPVVILLRGHIAEVLERTMADHDVAFDTDSRASVYFPDAYGPDAQRR